MWKDTKHLTSSGKCKLKQRDTTSYFLEWPQPRTVATLNPGEGVEQQELSFIAGGDAKWYCYFVRHLFLSKQNILLPYDPEIALLGIYPKELKNRVHTKTCKWMFIPALFIIAKIWKQP